MSFAENTHCENMNTSLGRHTQEATETDKVSSPEIKLPDARHLHNNREI